MELYIINKDGESLDLLNNSKYFIMTKCEALHGIDTELAEIDSPYIDGSQIEHVKALPRGISLTLKLVPDIRDSIDFVTSIIKSKQYVTLHEIEKNRDITIKGVVKIPPYTRMLSMCELTLDIYCPAPYWQDLNDVIGSIAMQIALLNFPSPNGQYLPYSIGRPFSVVNLDLEKTYNNNGDTTTGMLIYVNAIGELKNPTIHCSTGEQNGYSMTINYTLNEGDEVIINTNRGQKSIMLNGSINLLQYLTFTGDDWLQLETGDNTFNITADDDTESNAYFTITFKRKYE